MGPDSRIATDQMKACGVLKRRAVQEQSFRLSDHLEILVRNLRPVPFKVPLPDALIWTPRFPWHGQRVEEFPNR